MCVLCVCVKIERKSREEEETSGDFWVLLSVCVGVVLCVCVVLFFL